MPTNTVCIQKLVKIRIKIALLAKLMFREAFSTDHVIERFFK